MSGRLLTLDDLITFTERKTRFHQEDARTLWLWLVVRSDAELTVHPSDGGRSVPCRSALRLSDAGKFGLTIDHKSLMTYGGGLKELRGTGLTTPPSNYLHAVRGSTVNGRSLLADWVDSLSDMSRSRR